MPGWGATVHRDGRDNCTGPALASSSKMPLGQASDLCEAGSQRGSQSHTGTSSDLSLLSCWLSCLRQGWLSKRSLGFSLGSFQPPHTACLQEEGLLYGSKGGASIPGGCCLIKIREPPPRPWGGRRGPPPASQGRLCCGSSSFLTTSSEPVQRLLAPHKPRASRKGGISPAGSLPQPHLPSPLSARPSTDVHSPWVGKPAPS